MSSGLIGARRERRWACAGGWLTGLLVLLLVTVATCAAALMALAAGALEGVDIVIDGEPWVHGAPGVGHFLATMAAVIVGGLVVLVAVPLGVLLTLGAAALAVGLVLFAVLVLAAIAFSPLWLVAALLWLVLRRKRAPATTMSA